MARKKRNKILKIVISVTVGLVVLLFLYVLYAMIVISRSNPHAYA